MGWYGSVHAFFMYYLCNLCNFNLYLYIHNLGALRLSLNHLWNGDFTVLLEGVHHQTIAADVVNAL